MQIANATPIQIPKRNHPRPKTTDTVPHKQIGEKAVPKIHTELMRRTFALSGVMRGSSFTPYPDAVGIHVRKNVAIKRPAAMLSGTEFSHFHPDGSLHAPLPPKLAKEVVKKGWATIHPYANQKKGWEGLVLIYTPKTKAEMDVVFRLIIASYNFVTGSKQKIK